MKDKVRTILIDLERVRENLLALSDNIWLSIDHNDNHALQEGVKFKGQYNDKMCAFDRVATELSALVQKFTDVHLDPMSSPSASGNNAENSERVIKELDKNEPHSLKESFTYKRPFDFVLLGRAFKDILTWRQVYELVCRLLADKNLKLFAALPKNSDYTSNRGNSIFATKPDNLRLAMKITDSVFAEANLSANNIRDNIVKLLKTFSISTKEMKIYLREDRDAT